MEAFGSGEAQAERSDRSAASLVHPLQQTVELERNELCFLAQDDARVRQLHMSRPAHEETVTKRGFQAHDLAAQMRLRDAEPLGGAAEASRVCYRHEASQPFQVDFVQDRPAIGALDWTDDVHSSASRAAINCRMGIARPPVAANRCAESARAPPVL